MPTAVSIQIREVSNKKDTRRFVSFQNQLYKGNPYYVPTLVGSEVNSFSLSNPMLRNCEFKLWIALKGTTIIGRIAAIINHSFNDLNNQKQARFSHFDCIDSKNVAESLLAEAENWALAKGMNEVIGPFGFSNLDKHGLLVEGFEELACQSSNYNFPYYQNLIEGFGYAKKHDWVERKVNIPPTIPPKLKRLSDLILKKYELKSIDLKNKKELLHYAPHVFDLYNTTYAKLYGVSPLDEEQKNHLLKQFIPYLDPDFVSIVVNKNDRIVAFGISMPSLSKALQKTKGKLFPFGIFHLLLSKRENDILDLLLVGIDPEYQRKGLNAILFYKSAQAIYKNDIRIMETTQNLESNKDVVNLWAGMDSELHKRARLYFKQI